MSHTKIHPVIHTFWLLVSEEKHWWRELSLITGQSSAFYTSHMLTKIAYLKKKASASLHSKKVPTSSKIDKLFEKFRKNSQRAFKFFGWDNPLGVCYNMFGILYFRAHNYESAIDSSKEALGSVHKYFGGGGAGQLKMFVVKLF